MKIAVLSDIHDRLDHLQSALSDIKRRSCERLFFLGDFCAPFSLEALASGFAGPIDSVFGNNDGDVFLLHRTAARHPHVTLHHPVAELEIAGRRILLNHYPEISRRLARAGDVDAVFSGHDHQRYIEHFGATLWANPGEIMGRFGVVSYGVYDTAGNAFEHFIVS
ncbi:MAG: metallophosphoesterase family protein [Verrucomicrobiales bacterium]